MPTLRWLGPGLLREGGETVPQGGTFSVSECRAAQLLARPDVEAVALAPALTTLARSGRRAKRSFDALASAAATAAPNQDLPEQSGPNTDEKED